MSDELTTAERQAIDIFRKYSKQWKEDDRRQIEAVMDDVCNFLDRMCHEGQWGVLDAVCRAWPTGCNPRSLQLTIGVLTATLAAKQHIPGRAVLLESAKLTWGDRPEYWGGLE